MTPVNIVMEAPGPEGRLRSRGPRFPVLSQCRLCLDSAHLPSGAPLTQWESHGAWPLCLLLTERCVLRLSAYSKCWDLAPLWLSDAPPCGVGLLVYWWTLALAALPLWTCVERILHRHVLLLLLRSYTEWGCWCSL